MRIEPVSDKTLELKEKMSKIFSENGIDNGIEVKYKSFAYTIKDDEENILGGIFGRKLYDEIHISELCLNKSIRGQGFGRKLLEIVEKEVDDGACEFVDLNTTSFQNAVEFYKKCGFEVEFVRKHKNNSRFDKYYMVKKLRDGSISHDY
ncbi:MAG: GNAT family N-acetyltransferase [Rickettsiales bacterium]|nr:GNAT family N-acetyltransferase [Rickettsiales bacterium]